MAVAPPTQTERIEEYRPGPLAEVEYPHKEGLTTLSICPRCKRQGYDLRGKERGNVDQHGFFSIRYLHPRGEVVYKDVNTNEIIERNPIEQQICIVGKAIGMDRAFKIQPQEMLGFSAIKAKEKEKRRGPGRPRKVSVEQQLDQYQQQQRVHVKRGRGRPKGSKTKPKKEVKSIEKDQKQLLSENIQTAVPINREIITNIMEHVEGILLVLRNALQSSPEGAFTDIEYRRHRERR
jgi:hypothetical protein